MSDDLFTKLVSTLTSLPGIGKKSAYRIGFHLLRSDEATFRQFISSLTMVKERLKFCSLCGGITEFEVCDICSSLNRDKSIICVVEQPEDIFFIENTGEFKGKYHVLNGSISPLDGVGPDQLRIKSLITRVEEDPVAEILIATNPTIEGDVTATYIHNILKEKNIRATRIAHGVAVGSMLEFADQYTLGKAIKSRLVL